MRDNISPTNHLNFKKKKWSHEESSSTTPQSSSQDDNTCDALDRKRDFISRLPLELSFNILLKLPIKTLCHSRWVSKTWQNTTKHTGFIKMHQTKVLQTNSPGLIFLNKGSHEELYLVDHQCLDEFLIDPSTQPIPKYPNPWTVENLQMFIDRPCPEIPSVNSVTLKTPKQMNLLFSCNGIVFSGIEPYFMCNPITGEYIDIPNPVYHGWGHLVMGFGFDVVSNVFKVVRMMSVKNEFHIPETDAEIYDSGTGKWKVMTNLPYFYADDVVQTNLNVFLKGALHWIGGDPEPRSPVGVVTFDLHTEEFGVISAHRGLELCSWDLHHYLLVLGDCLCICHKIKREHIEIYVMKEYGVESSWVKEYVIKDLEWDFSDIYGPYKPIKMMKNGEILMMCYGEAFGYYNPINKVFRRLHASVGFPCSQPVLHVASLISPTNGGN